MSQRAAHAEERPGCSEAHSIDVVSRLGHLPHRLDGPRMTALTDHDPTLRRDLSALFSPSSIAIVGASNDPAKYGNWLAVRALRLD